MIYHAFLSIASVAAILASVALLAVLSALTLTPLDKFGRSVVPFLISLLAIWAGATRPHTRGPSAGVGRALRRSWRSSPQAGDAPTATVAPHQEGHDECPHSQQKQTHQLDDRWYEALVGHYHRAVVHERSSGNCCYHSHPARVDPTECDGQAEQEEGHSCKEERKAVHRYLRPPNRLGCREGGSLLRGRSTRPGVHRPL